MDKSWPRKAANMFWMAAARNKEQRQISATQMEMLLVPSVVCAAFAIELGIKAMLLPTGKTIKKHDLRKLFDALPESIQQEIISSCHKPLNEFNASLDSMANTFDEWRYVFELQSATVDLEFLELFGSAVRIATETHAP